MAQASVLTVLVLTGLAIAQTGMPQKAAPTGPRAVVRLPHIQRAGGPLPLSLQNEVEAAIERARRYLQRTLIHAETSDPKTADSIEALVWILTALSGDPDPQSIHLVDTQLAPWRILPPEMDADRATAPSLWLHALSAARANRPPDSDLRHLFARVLQAHVPREATKCRSCTPPSFPKHAADGTDALPPGSDTTRLLLLLDAATMAGFAPDALLDPPTRQRLLHHPGLRYIAADTAAPTAPQPMAAAIVALHIAHALSAPVDATTFPRLAQAITRHRAYLPADIGDADPWMRAWLCVRLLDREAPGMLVPEATERTVDWRIETARRLVGSQRIDTRDGAGFWGEPEPADADDPVVRRHTALAILILETL